MRYLGLLCANAVSNSSRRLVSQRRVQSVLVGLERLHEAFGLGVVEGTAGPADGNVVLGQPLTIDDGGVLGPIRTMQQHVRLPRRPIAITKASVTNWAVIAAFIDQPTTRREERSTKAAT
jgi:hypothetical protein